MAIVLVPVIERVPRAGMQGLGALCATPGGNPRLLWPTVVVSMISGPADMLGSVERKASHGTREDVIVVMSF